MTRFSHIIDPISTPKSGHWPSNGQTRCQRTHNCGTARTNASPKPNTDSARATADSEETLPPPGQRSANGPDDSLIVEAQHLTPRKSPSRKSGSAKLRFLNPSVAKVIPEEFFYFFDDSHLFLFFPGSGGARHKSKNCRLCLTPRGTPVLQCGQFLPPQSPQRGALVRHCPPRCAVLHLTLFCRNDQILRRCRKHFRASKPDELCCASDAWRDLRPRDDAPPQPFWETDALWDSLLVRRFECVELVTSPTFATSGRVVRLPVRVGD